MFMFCWSGYQPGIRPLLGTGCCCTTGCSTTGRSTGRSALGLDAARTTAMTTATIAMSTKIEVVPFFVEFEVAVPHLRPA